MKIKKKSYFSFFELSPFAVWTLKICNHDISKTITARSFKLGKLIEDEEISINENLKRSYFLFF